MLLISKASKELNIKASVLKQHINNGYINAINGKIPKKEVERISKQRKEYIGFKEFMLGQETKRFNPQLAKHRNNYLNYLEENDFFGIKIYYTSDLLSTFSTMEEFFFKRADISFIEFKCEKFLANYGLSEEEKIEILLNRPYASPKTVWGIKRFITELKKRNFTYTPSLTECVEILIDSGDIETFDDEDIIQMLYSANTIRTKEYLIEFFNYSINYDEVKYHRVNKKKKESTSVPAYDYDTFARIAVCIFNSENEKELIYKALNNHLYAEQWLFLAIHYVCSWRASDICNHWVYPNLNENNSFNLNMSTLGEDLINDNINEETLLNIVKYTIKKIELSQVYPAKTGDKAEGTLSALISDELQSFFGKLILLAEYHHHVSGEGYMKTSRYKSYCNWVTCKNFFGDEFHNILGKQNIKTRRLNKSFIQSLEVKSRERGNSPLIAHVLASMARNHSNINTTSVYIRDHGITGENAGMVLYMMMERGVMSVYAYKMLTTAFPGAFKQLTEREKTLLINHIPLSAYELETIGYVYNAREDLTETLSTFNFHESVQILKAMYEIGNNNGKSKVKGVYCLKTALGFSCEYPADDCLANLCPNHIFTKHGIPALVDIINLYQKKYMETGNEKYKNIVLKKIVPFYHDILKELSRNMSETEQKTVRKLIEEGLNE